MERLRPAWVVALCAVVLLASAWLPWLNGSAGRANAIGGKIGHIAVPPPGFGVGQAIVLLSSCLLVSAAMTARKLAPRAASAVALVLSLGITALAAWYYRIYVHDPVTAAYGVYLGMGIAALAALLSVPAVVVAWGEGR